jgi:hypothetical protein
MILSGPTFDFGMFAFFLIVINALGAPVRLMLALAIAWGFGYCVGNTTPVMAADCPGRTVLTLVDATTPYDDLDRAAIMPAIGQMSATLRPGDHLKVITVAESPAKSLTLVDGCVPQPDGGWIARLFSNPHARMREFLNAAGQQIEPVLWQRHDKPATALVQTLTEAMPADEVWMLTDGLESSLISPRRLLDGSAVIDTEGPRMDGITIHMTGLGRYHDDARKPLSVEEQEHMVEVWRRWLSGLGARLVVE